VDFHKRYSVYCIVDGAGIVLERGRIEHQQHEQFGVLMRRWPGRRVVMEATMNWHWLYEVLERDVPAADLVLANPFKTRIIAEAQVKTDKIDAQILAQLLRANLISSIHIPAKATRERKEVLRQRAFFVRQRTMLRNRIHRLLGAQHDVKLPQCCDLFGRKGVGFLEKLQLPEPAGLLLKQQLEMLKTVQMRIKEDERALGEMMKETSALRHVQSLPGMGPILAAVVVNEVDDISRFSTAQKFCGYAGLCPSTSSSGGRTCQGKLLRHCNKWLRWAFVEAAWVSIGCSSYFGDFYKRKRAAGKKANTAILATARRMARITWQLLTQKRAYEIMAPAQSRSRPVSGAKAPAGSAKEGSRREYVLKRKPPKPTKISPMEKPFPSRSKSHMVGRSALS
jgi:transposase